MKILNLIFENLYSFVNRFLSRIVFNRVTLAFTFRNLIMNYDSLLSKVFEITEMWSIADKYTNRFLLMRLLSADVEEAVIESQFQRKKERTFVTHVIVHHKKICTLVHIYRIEKKAKKDIKNFPQKILQNQPVILTFQLFSFLLDLCVYLSHVSNFTIWICVWDVNCFFALQFKIRD